MDREQRETRAALLAQPMAFVAGFVDAVGYLVLVHMFTANMSGNSVALGIFIGQGSWSRILDRAFPIPFFMLGVAAGSSIIMLLKRRNRAPFPAVLLLEAFLISLFWLAGEQVYSMQTERLESSRFYALAALLPLAMGLQTAVLHRAGSIALRTTFVTGMMATSCREFVNACFRFRDRLNTGDPASDVLRHSFRDRSSIRMVLTASIWIIYIGGAAAGGFLLADWDLRSLVVPIAVLLAVAARASLPARSKPGRT